jgi:SAM-dependent methyltransferase
MAAVLERASRADATAAPATSFSAGWLALREPADHAARSLPLTRALAAALPAAPPTCVLDLGAGTGSNLRFLAARLGGEQRWLLVDRDAALLAHAAQHASGDESAVHVEVRDVDLSTLADPSTRELFDGRALVTASALLDLVSEAWIRALVTRCRERGAAVLFALSYDGRIHCAPEDVEDEMVRDLVNRHQRTDKGFGSALGPAATDAAARAFTGAGYQVRRERSDWTLTPEQGALQRELIEGWADAASLMAPERAAAIDGWRIRRLAHVDAERSRLTVGHEDLAAWLPPPS